MQPIEVASNYHLCLHKKASKLYQIYCFQQTPKHSISVNIEQCPQTLSHRAAPGKYSGQWFQKPQESMQNGHTPPSHSQQKFQCLKTDWNFSNHFPISMPAACVPPALSAPVPRKWYLQLGDSCSALLGLGRVAWGEGTSLPPSRHLPALFHNDTVH